MLIALAVTLATSVATVGCSQNNADDAFGSKGPERSARTETLANYERFRELMESRDALYSFETTDEASIGEGSLSESFSFSSSGVVDERGEELLGYMKCDFSDEEPFELYKENGALVRVWYDEAEDVTAIMPEGFLDYGPTCITWHETFGAGDLISYSKESGFEEFVFSLSDNSDVDPEWVAYVAEGSATYRFDDSGHLVGDRIELRGNGKIGEKLAPAWRTIQSTYSDFGEAVIPERAVDVTQVAKDCSSESVIKTLREAIGNFPSNVTFITNATITTRNGGEEQVSTRVMGLMIDDIERPHYNLYLEEDGNEEDATDIYVKDGKAITVRHDEIVSVSEADELSDPFGFEGALAALDCAQDVTTYELTTGETHYILILDPDEYFQANPTKDIEEPLSVRLDYYLDEAGLIQLVWVEASGYSREGDPESLVTYDISAVYTEYGTTEVFDLPEDSY